MPSPRLARASPPKIDFAFLMRAIFPTNFSLAKLIQIEVKRSSTILQYEVVYGNTKAWQFGSATDASGIWRMGHRRRRLGIRLGKSRRLGFRRGHRARPRTV